MIFGQSVVPPSSISDATYPASMPGRSRVRERLATPITFNSTPAASCNFLRAASWRQSAEPTRPVAPAMMRLRVLVPRTMASCGDRRVSGEPTAALTGFIMRIVAFPSFDTTLAPDARESRSRSG